MLLRLPSCALQTLVCRARWIFKRSDRARRMYAMTRDRDLLSIDEPQQFGTQYTLEDGQWKLQPYDLQTTDAERAAYDVAPLAQISTGLTGALSAGWWDRVQMALFNPLTVLLIQLLVLMGTIRLVWMGLRWLVRTLKRRRASTRQCDRTSRVNADPW